MITYMIFLIFRWGCEHELKARKMYEAYATQQHQDLSVCDAGLHIDPSRPYLGASPDALLSCSCCGDGILEIKCPHCAKDTGILSTTEKKHFCIENTDGTYALNRDHQYHYQVQAQLFVTKRKFCDFMVWSTSNFFIQRILPDADFITEAVQNVEAFYRSAILSELLAKTYTCPDRLLSDKTQSTDLQGLEEE